MRAIRRYVQAWWAAPAVVGAVAAFMSGLSDVMAQDLEDGRELAKDRGNVAGELACAAAGAGADVDDDHLFGLRERGGNLARDVGGARGRSSC